MQAAVETQLPKEILLDKRIRRAIARFLHSRLDALGAHSEPRCVAATHRISSLCHPGARGRPGSDEELHFLKSNAGRLSMKALAARLSRSYYSVKAAIRSTELDGRVTDGYSVDELARTFGVGKATIHRWIVRGWITRNEGRITETSVLRFLRFRPHEYQLRRVDEVWFKALVFAPRHSAR
jgi:hypothetical protein